MANVELKQPVVQEIADLFDGAEAVVLVDARGLSVESDTKLRKQLREAEVTYKVYKNTMIRLAIKGTPYESLSSALQGPTAVAVSKKDASVPAKMLYNFSKTEPAMELKCGVVEGVFYDSKDILEVAQIPSRNELLSQFLGSIQSPLSGFARVIKQIAEKNGGEDEAA